MSEQASFALRGRNPDVLTCIANLSNDEVFTPPALANRMLDDLANAWSDAHDGESIWESSSVTFLDPCTKLGVFLREIAVRLIAGLEKEIPDLQTRVEHVLTKQVFGIALTELTSLLSRRTLYCSKSTLSPHSITKSFKRPGGNIWYERTEHSWHLGRCIHCGASEAQLDRGSDLETHAYGFIHGENIREEIAQFFGGRMQFDVIIGNPPYQMKDGGHQASATPIYQKFVEAAIGLDPHYVVMVTPSRWFQGGRGLDEFRSRMLSDKRLRRIVDYIREKDAFPSINVNGGVNYFLWDRNHNGDCAVQTIEIGAKEGDSVERPLDEFDVFVRRNDALPILRKVINAKEYSFSSRVSALKPFGFRTNFHGASAQSSSANIRLYGSGKVSWVARKQIETHQEWVDRWKVLIAAATDGNETYPLPIWDKKGPFVARPGEACTETYLVAYVADSEQEAIYARNYMRTKFFRFLVSLRKIAQHNKSENFSFVPLLPMDRDWDDNSLFLRYGFSSDEISFIDSIIRSIEWE